MRILLVSPHLPVRAPASGGVHALATLATALAKHHDLAVVAVRRPGESEEDAIPVFREVRTHPCTELVDLPTLTRLRLRAGALAGVPADAARVRHSGLWRTVADLACEWSPDVLTVAYSYMWLPPAWRGAPHPPIPEVLMDFDPRSASGTYDRHGLVARVEHAAWRRWDRRAGRHCDAILALCDADARHLRGLNPDTDVHVVGLPITSPGRACDPVGDDDGHSMLFVGNFGHPPNVDTALRLAREVLPRVRERVPGARLILAGAGPPAALLDLRSPDIEVPGFLPDLTDIMNHACLVVAPITLGGGVRVKMIEALAAGKAVLASPRALQGLDVRDGHDCVIAESGDAFAEQAVRLLLDPSARRTLGTAARARRTDTTEATRVADQLSSIYAGITSRRT